MNSKSLAIEFLATIFILAAVSATGIILGMQIQKRIDGEECAAESRRVVQIEPPGAVCSVTEFQRNACSAYITGMSPGPCSCSYTLSQGTLC